MHPSSAPPDRMTIPELTEMAGQIQGLWWSMKDLAKTHPSRELSLAITNVQQGMMWLSECDHLDHYQMPIPDTIAASQETGNKIATLVDQLRELNTNEAIQRRIANELHQAGIVFMVR